MNDVLTLAVFAAKVLCLMVFVTILKPDGSIGSIRTSPKPSTAGRTVRQCWNAVSFASRRQIMHRTSECCSLLNNNPRMPQSS
jgi:hypothetical protein